MSPQPTLADPIATRAADIDATAAPVPPERCTEVCGAPCVRTSDGASHCGKVCASDRDCGADAICFPTTAGNARCTPSQCGGIGRDADCPDGWTCLAISRASAAAYVCAKAGVRTSGERCLGIGTPTTAPEDACASGLLCAEGTCLPQRCGHDADCPTGAHGAADSGGLMPEPRCVLGACGTDADCAAGLACIAYPAGRRSCVRRGHAACLENGCERGLACTVKFPLLPDLHAECQKPCSTDRPACAADELCAPSEYGGEASATCVQTCAPDGDHCPSGKVCVPSAEGPATCRVAATGRGVVTP